VADEPKTTVLASVILERIKDGIPVECDDVIIEGDLDLSTLDLPKQQVERTEFEIKVLGLSEIVKAVASSIQITNSEIKGSVTFSNCILQKEVSFSGAKFEGYAYFSGAKFEGYAYFSGAKFGGDAYFSGAKFEGYAYFSGAKFGGDAYFRDAKFEGYAGFSGAKFGGNAYFRDAKFEGYADFSGAKFGGDADFSGAKFGGDADFSGAKFEGYADFRDAKFGGDADFSGAKFGGYADFSGAKFGGDAYFSGAKFGGNAGFRDAKFGGDADFRDAKFEGYADFSGAKFEGYADFSGAKFGGNAYFRGTQFTGDVLTFRNAIFADPGSQENACRRAKNVQEKAGDREEAGYHFYREWEGRRKSKGIDYEYFDYEILFSCKIDKGELQAIQSRELTSLRKYVWYNKIEYLLFQLIFGYGVHPIRLWGWWFFFVFLFAAIYWIGNGVTDATTKQPLTDPLAYIWFSITVAVTPGFAGYKPAAGWYQLLAGLEAIFGTFMWAAFITTFARKYMR